MVYAKLIVTFLNSNASERNTDQESKQRKIDIVCFVLFKSNQAQSVRLELGNSQINKRKVLTSIFPFLMGISLRVLM